MATTLASLVVRIGADVRGLTDGLSSLDRRMKRQEKNARQLAGVFRGLLVGGAIQAGREVFELGATVEETGSKFQSVFGESAEAVEQFNASFGAMAGLSRTQAREVTATTGAIVQGMGFAQEASASLAQEIVRTAGDLSSFNNVPIADSSRAIQAALAGEREQLKRYGVVIREADVQRRALAQSGKTVASSLTQQEKVTATLSLITERMGVAVGDLARTQDSAANQARRLGAEVQTLKEEMAVALLPVFAAVTQRVLEFIKGIQIMAAETAVVIARMKFWKEVMFGTEEAAIRANDELRNMRVAAAEVKAEIIGLNVELPTLNSQLQETGTELNIASASAVVFESQIPGITVGVKLFASAQTALATATNEANEALARQASIMAKGAAILGGLNAISRFLPFAIPGLGSAGGIFSAIGTIQGAFGKGDGGAGGGLNSKAGAGGSKIVASSTTGPARGDGAVSLVLDFSKFPPARDPISAARDGEWQRFFLDTYGVARANGALV